MALLVQQHAKAAPVPAVQLRRLVLLLPEALGADQPGALASVLEHFGAEAGQAGAVRSWDFVQLTQVRLLTRVGGRCIGLE
jgi:hypothetical protein